MADSPIDIRAATADDLEAIVSLAGRALRWRHDEPNRALFDWKHRHNPFGPSWLWVAEAKGVLVGFRALMRWEFATADGTIAQAVRPVDTATHPDHQGRGIFRRLTEHAIEVLEDEGVSFVFNTPNDQSRPGYLKMGWAVAGQVPTHVRPRSILALPRLAGARQPAQKWSEQARVGQPAAAVFGAALVEDGGRAVTALADRCRRTTGLTTNRSPRFMAWRYGLEPLHYRVLGDQRDGLIVFRLRRRGRAVEAVIADLLAPDRRTARELLAELRRRSRAHYLLAAGRRPPGLVRLPAQGPILTVRALADRPPGLDDLDFTLGDIELF